MSKLSFVRIVASASISLLLGLMLLNLNPASAENSSGTSYNPMLVSMNQGPATVVIDGKVIALRQTPVDINDHVMVSLRGIFENLGAYVSYLPETRSVIVTSAGKRIALTLDSPQAIVDGQSQTLDAPPILMGGVVMVPLRFVSEALGADVQWVASTRTVNIESRIGGVELPFSPVSTSQLITSVSTSPNEVIVGRTVTATMQGTPGGTAYMSIGGGDKVLMEETSPGKYVGTYTVPSTLAGGAADVVAFLEMPDGLKDTKIETAALSVKTLPVITPLAGPGTLLPLMVTAPNPAADVPAVFDVFGSTERHALVRLQVLVQRGGFLFFGGSHWEQIVSTQTYADIDGNYHFRVDTSSVGPGSHLKVVMTSENRKGAYSKELTMELTRNIIQ